MQDEDGVVWLSSDEETNAPLLLDELGTPITHAQSRGRSYSQPCLTDTPKRFQPITQAIENIMASSSAPRVTQSLQSSPSKKGRKAKQPTVPDEFFGVYCLISRSPLKHYKNRCYIGFTVDPNRRIDQHNGGRQKGGAKKTENRGPWEMVCIIHGFPCNVAALRFEWAWQNPDKSRSLKGHEIDKRKYKETPFAHKIRIACHLLNSDPFRRLGLTFQWLIPEEKIPFPAAQLPPLHVVEDFGKVPTDIASVKTIDSCCLCNAMINKFTELARCPKCFVHFHMTCLALDALKRSNSDYSLFLFPTEVTCMKCQEKYTWADVVRDQRMLAKIDAVQTVPNLQGKVPLAI